MQGAIEKDFLYLLSAHCTTEKGVRKYTLFLRAIGAAGAQLPYKQKVTSSNLVSPTIYFRALYNARFLFWALSAAGEHHRRTVGVAGSNPVAPTIELHGQKLVCFWLFYFASSFDFFSGLSLVIRGIMSCLFSFPF